MFGFPKISGKGQVWLPLTVCHVDADFSTDRSGCSFTLHQRMMRVTQQGAKHVLHYDDADSIFIQVRGSKQVILVPTPQLPFIYPVPSPDILARRAQINLSRPDFGKYPDSAFITPKSVTLHAGDILFVPHRSAHESVSISDSVTITARLETACYA